VRGCTDESAHLAQQIRARAICSWDHEPPGLQNFCLSADVVQRRSWFQSPVTRVKRREQRTGLRQSGCDRSTILTGARCGVDRHRVLQRVDAPVKRRKRRNGFLASRR
jgi:hypothetical protein